MLFQSFGAKLMLILDVSGDIVRKNVKENEKGVDLHLDIQVVDITTCTPLREQAIEIWSANATISSTVENPGNLALIDCIRGHTAAS
jgi:hypothetical protein